MADVQTTDINTKPTVTTIDSNDQIFISDGGTALKKISYTNLAKAIIEQYNASQLAGATKTIQTAFNELNRNISFLTQEVENFDTFYNTSNTATTVRGRSTNATATNPPIAGDGITYYVEYIGSASYGIQSATIHYATTAINRGRTFKRFRNNGSWGAWVEDTISAFGWMQSGTNLNNLVVEGTYGLSASSNYTNLPTGVTNGILEVFSPSITGGYCMQRLTTTNSIYVRYRNASSGTDFGGWYKYTGTAVQ